MKIYTKSGDTGDTGLYGGSRISKGELRIESYGAVDELNSYLGLIANFELECIKSDFLYDLQSILFDMGSYLASVPGKKLNLPELKEESVLEVEKEIDEMSGILPPLKSFILPGGSSEASHVHIARTICRRAERRIVSLNKLEPVNPLILRFTNRLSDYLFVLARMVILEQGRNEIMWKPRK